MEAADGADLFGWHSSMVVLEDGKDGEEGSDWTPSTNWILQFTQLSNGDHKQESEFTQLRFHFNQLDLTKKCKQFLKQCLSVVIVVIECLTSSV